MANNEKGRETHYNVKQEFKIRVKKKTEERDTKIYKNWRSTTIQTRKKKDNKRPEKI